MAWLTISRLECCQPEGEGALRHPEKALECCWPTTTPCFETD